MGHRDDVTELRTNPELARIEENFARGRITRREFTSRLLALGLSGPAIGAALAAGGAEAATPRKGGRLRLALTSASATDTLWPPKSTSSTDHVRIFQIYNHLVRISPELSPVPDLAESWESNDTVDDWVFKLRKGVEFHNGKTLTADDVLYSISLHTAEDSKSAARAMMSDVVEVKAEDKHTVRVKLAAPNADFPVYFGGIHMGIVPEGSTESDDPIGTGPFKIKTFNPGVSSVTVRNENYWRDGLPYVDELETIGIPESTARTNALLAGSVDMISRVDAKTVGLINGSPKHTVVNTRSGLHVNMVMMTDRPPTDNIDLRRGLKYLSDREAVLQSALQGLGQLGNDHPIAPSDPFYCDDLPLRPYDPDKAKFYLKKAGAENLTIELHTSMEIAPGGVEEALIFQQTAAKAGVTIEIKLEPSDGYWKRVWQQFPFHMARWNARPTADMMFSIAYASDAPWNETHWKDERLDKALKEARATRDFDKRKELYCVAQRRVHEDGGTIIPVFADYLDAMSTNVKGFVSNPSGVVGGFRGPETVWLDT